jgi:hypothetical protein
MGDFTLKILIRKADFQGTPRLHFTWSPQSAPKAAIPL